MPGAFEHQRQNDDADQSVQRHGFAAAQSDFLPAGKQVDATSEGGGNEDETDQTVNEVSFQPLQSGLGQEQ